MDSATQRKPLLQSSNIPMTSRLAPSEKTLALAMATPVSTPDKRTTLHICTRETIRPLRDRILTLQGFEVDSTLSYEEGLSIFRRGQYDLVLIDVEGEKGIEKAEHTCSVIKTTQP